MSNNIWLLRKPYRFREGISRPLDLVNEERHFVGSAMTKNGLDYKGLTTEEEYILLPELLDMSSTHPDFYLHCNRFFSDMRIEVPPGGLKLDISLRDDSKPFSAENRPNNSLDYVYYKYCQNYPRVGSSKLDALENENKLFYLHSEEEDSKTRNAVAKQKRDAMAKLTKVLDDEVYLNSVLRYYYAKYDKGVPNPDELSFSDKETQLTTLAVEDPSGLTSIIENKNVKDIGLIFELLDNKLINKVMSNYYYLDNDLGSSEDEVIKFLNQAANSKTFAHLKGQLETIKKEKKKSE